MKALKVGDPVASTTDVGPLATSQIVGELDDQVKRAVAGGGKLLTGGKRISGPGNFYEPTALGGVPQNCPVYLRGDLRAGCDAVPGERYR